MNASNNINGIGAVKRTDVYTLRSASLLAAQEALVRWLVTELNDFDNLYYEICNEPYFGGVTMEWQNRIAATIVKTEKSFKHRHLIAQNVANKSQRIVKPNPHVSVFNFHYAEPLAAGENYRLNKALGDDETGFKGDPPGPYRMEAWEFMLAGGAVISNLDYSFTCGKEDGTANPKAPGSRGPQIRKQLEVLKDFMNRLNFIRMKPDAHSIKRIVGAKATARALVEPGRTYAIYIRGEGPVTLTLAMTPGRYGVQWIDPQTGNDTAATKIQAGTSNTSLESPAFKEDIALLVRRLR
jgi:hypothetical protein